MGPPVAACKEVTSPPICLIQTQTKLSRVQLFNCRIMGFKTLCQEQMGDIMDTTYTVHYYTEPAQKH